MLQVGQPRTAGCAGGGASRLRRRHVGRHGTQVELVRAFVVDEQVGAQRQHFVAHDHDIVARGDAFATGIEDLERHAKLARRGPHVQPVADELGIRIGKVVTADGGRGADEGDAHRPRLARERHGWSAKAVVVGDQADRRRRVGQEPVGRPRLTRWRIVQIKVARRAGEIGVATRIADKVGVPGLEHVGPPRAVGDAAQFDLAYQVEPFLRYRSAVWQRRWIGEEPCAIDAGRKGDLVEMPSHGRVVGVRVELAHDKFGRGGAERNRDHDQKNVQPKPSHDLAPTRFVEPGRQFIEPRLPRAGWMQKGGASSTRHAASPPMYLQQLLPFIRRWRRSRNCLFCTDFLH